MSRSSCPISRPRAALYRDSARRPGLASRSALPAHGVTVVFVELPNTKIELLEPLGANFAGARLSRRAIRRAACTISATRSTTSSPRATGCGPEGARVLGDGEPRLGAHDKPVLFLHPKDFCGTLIELEQA